MKRVPYIEDDEFRRVTSGATSREPVLTAPSRSDWVRSHRQAYAEMRGRDSLRPVMSGAQPPPYSPEARLNQAGFDALENAADTVTLSALLGFAARFKRLAGLGGKVRATQGEFDFGGARAKALDKLPDAKKKLSDAVDELNEMAKGGPAKSGAPARPEPSARPEPPVHAGETVSEEPAKKVSLAARFYKNRFGKWTTRLAAGTAAVTAVGTGVNAVRDKNAKRRAAAETVEFLRQRESDREALRFLMESPDVSGEDVLDKAFSSDQSYHNYQRNIAELLTKTYASRAVSGDDGFRRELEGYAEQVKNNLMLHDAPAVRYYRDRFRARGLVEPLDALGPAFDAVDERLRKGGTSDGR